MAALSRELWLVAFFLSKYGSTNEGKQTTPPIELNTHNWKDAYRLFYDKFGDGKTVKTFEHSLKNCRDTYDGHIQTSSRKGWRDLSGKPVKLLPLPKSVFNKYNTESRESIWGEINSLILSSKSKTLIPKVRNMPSGKKTNPDWKREELILALDLYFKLDYGQMHGKNSDIINLSSELRQLSIHQNIPDTNAFRSVNSVALKLANIKKLDQNFSGKGMRDGGKLEREIWDEFHRHRDTLKKEAELIRHLYLLKSKPTNPAVVGEYNTKYKSEFLFQIHKNRENDPLVNKIKKELVLKTSKSLNCEVCGFNSTNFYGELGNDLMEIHHCKELKNESGLELSSMEDFIIVCSNCHKALDKNYGLLDAIDLKKIIRKR